MSKYEDSLLNNFQQNLVLLWTAIFFIYTVSYVKTKIKSQKLWSVSCYISNLLSVQIVTSKLISYPNHQALSLSFGNFNLIIYASMISSQSEDFEWYIMRKSRSYLTCKVPQCVDSSVQILIFKYSYIYNFEYYLYKTKYVGEYVWKSEYI